MEGFDFCVGSQKNVVIRDVVTMCIAKFAGIFCTVGKCNVILVLKVYHHAVELSLMHDPPTCMK